MPRCRRRGCQDRLNGRAPPRRKRVEPSMSVTRKSRSPTGDTCHGRRLPQQYGPLTVPASCPLVLVRLWQRRRAVSDRVCLFDSKSELGVLAGGHIGNDIEEPGQGSGVLRSTWLVSSRSEPELVQAVAARAKASSANERRTARGLLGTRRRGSDPTQDRHARRRSIRRTGSG